MSPSIYIYNTSHRILTSRYNMRSIDSSFLSTALSLLFAYVHNSRENSGRDEHNVYPDLLNALSSNYSVRVSQKKQGGREEVGRRGRGREGEETGAMRRGGREFPRALKSSLRANRSLCPRRGAGFMPLFMSRNFNLRLLHRHVKL